MPAPLWVLMATDNSVLAVRRATPADSEAIALIQADAVADAVAAALGPTQGEQIRRSLIPATMAQTWAATAADNSGEDRGVFVARKDEEVVGFAAFATPRERREVANPATAKALSQLPFEVPLDSAQILVFEVDREHRQQGHGSRLLSSIADTAASAGAPGLVVWIIGEDEARTRFFREVGFRPAGVRRNLDTGAGKVTEHLWFAALG